MDCMTFPKTFEEFAEQYKIVDNKEVYTNGTELIPIFRVKQWLEHQIKKYCKYDTSRKRPKTTPACKCYKERGAE